MTAGCYCTHHSHRLRVRQRYIVGPVRAGLIPSVCFGAFAEAVGSVEGEGVGFASGHPLVRMGPRTQSVMPWMRKDWMYCGIAQWSMSERVRSG